MEDKENSISFLGIIQNSRRTLPGGSQSQEASVYSIPLLGRSTTTPSSSALFCSRVTRRFGCQVRTSFPLDAIVCNGNNAHRGLWGRKKNLPTSADKAANRAFASMATFRRHADLATDGDMCQRFKRASQLQECSLFEKSQSDIETTTNSVTRRPEPKLGTPHE